MILFQNRFFNDFVKLISDIFLKSSVGTSDQILSFPAQISCSTAFKIALHGHLF